MNRRGMMLATACAAAIGMIVVAVWAAEQEAQEEQISIDQVPAAVKATILKEADGGRVAEIERETEAGKIVFEAEVLKDGVEFEITVAEDGTLIGKEREEADGDDDDDGEDDEDEQQLSIDQVPSPARDALTKLAGGATLAKVEQEKERGAVFFEAEWLVNGKGHEAKVTADGSLVENEEQIDAASVPPAVAAAAAKKFAGAEGVQFIKKVIVVYEVKAKKNGKTRELVFTAAGTRAGDDDDKGERRKERTSEKKQ